MLVWLWHAVDMHCYCFFPVTLSRVGFDPTSLPRLNSLISHLTDARSRSFPQQTFEHSIAVKKLTVINYTNNRCCSFRETISRPWVLTYFWANVDTQEYKHPK